MKNKYQPAKIFKYKNAKYQIEQDTIVSDKVDIDAEHFIFSTLNIQGKTLYFTVDAANHRASNINNHLSIGFWHTIINNQADDFNLDEGFQYKVEFEDEILFINYENGLINTGISYKASFESEKNSLENYQHLSVNADNYTNFTVIRSLQQKRDIKKKAQRKTAVKYATIWLIVSIIVGAYYFYKKTDFDQAELTRNALKNKILGLKKTYKNIKNSTIANENLALKHMENMLKFNQSYVVMEGKLDLISNKNTFSFHSNTDIKAIKHVSKTKDIAVKLDYDPLKRTTNVTWSVK